MRVSINLTRCGAIAAKWRAWLIRNCESKVGTKSQPTSEFKYFHFNISTLQHFCGLSAQPPPHSTDRPREEGGRRRREDARISATGKLAAGYAPPENNDATTTTTQPVWTRNGFCPLQVSVTARDWNWQATDHRGALLGGLQIWCLHRRGVMEKRT